MTFLLQIASGLLAVALAASLTACGSDGDATLDSTVARQGKVVANDCRAPDAQSTQRGCRPTTRMMGKL
jgi:hypothetical protein